MADLLWLYIGLSAGTAFGYVFRALLAESNKGLVDIEDSYMTFTDLQRELRENGMDENRDGMVEKAVKCRILINCPLDRSAERMVNHHGFKLVSGHYQRYSKEMTGTWSDIMTYAQILKGIEGIVNIELDFGDEAVGQIGKAAGIE